MAEGDNQQKRHFVLEGTGDSVPFQPNGGGDKPEVPRRNRGQHGAYLRGQINALKPTFDQAKEEQKAAGLEDDFGLQIEFESFPEIHLAFESLAREASSIELLNVREEDGITLATVYVPDGKLHILENLVVAYLDEANDNENGVPRNQRLLDAIQNIRVSSLKALWTDDPNVFPEEEESLWWEVWLPVRNDREAVIEKFKGLAAGLDFQVAQGQIEFPERSVLLIHGSVTQMQQSVLTLNSIAELRRAKETAEFFDSLPPAEQPQWSDELLQRLTIPAEAENVPHICVLDTGTNHEHPLLILGLIDADCHTVEPGWGTNDANGHGTEMAGLGLFGDLTPCLGGDHPIEVGHRLESVKILNDDGDNTQDPLHHGYLTTEAVSRPAISQPDRKRVFSMAVTAKDNRDKGRPSAWSSTIDRLSVDSDNDGEVPRLFVISAGNLDDPNAWANYPDSNSSESIHDPGQAWNALTVGASTVLFHITEPDTENYQPVAPVGGLSPFSTTSKDWESHWPLKPDVVFEGGNAAIDDLGAVWMPSLSVLTTDSEPAHRLFTTTNATSAASALASRMAAQLMAAYPELRLETIRGLVVHSAEWTDAMKDQFLPNPNNPSKSEVAVLVRNCGFGCPDLDRALWSTENSLTLICESSLIPFKREGNNPPTLKDMNFHELPWPLEELEALGETDVRMRVTLSYFVEPNPSARGVKSRYRYESHGLRFDVKRPHESDADFRARLNAIAEEGEEPAEGNAGNDPNWTVGTRSRHRGSIHSDTWTGRAADLASRGMIGVYPVSGWWKTRHKLGRYDHVANYTLLVSIEVPEVEVELYSAIANKIATVVEV